VIFFVALFLRLAYIHGFTLVHQGTNLEPLWTSFPFGAFFSGDAWHYHQNAIDVIEGRGLQFPFRPPLTAAILAAAYAIFRPEFVVGHWLFALLGAGVCAAVTAVGSRWFSRMVGACAGCLTAFSFSQIVLSGTYNSEIPSALLLLASLVVYERQGKVAAVLSGLLSGAACLARAEMLLVLAVMAIVEFVCSRRQRRRLAIAAVACFLTLSPWTVRNYLFMTKSYPSAPLAARIVPISANGGLNFYIGNGPAANGGYRSLSGVANPSDSGILLQFDNPRHQMILFRGYELGWTCARQRPDRLAELLPSKLMLSSRGLRNGFFLDNFPVGLRNWFRLGDIGSVDRAWPAVAVVSLSAVGLFILRRLNVRAVLLIGGYLVCVAVTSLVYFGLARHGAAALPFVYLGVAGALCAAGRWLAARAKKTVTAVALLGAACVFYQIFSAGRQMTRPTPVLMSSTLLHGIARVSPDEI